MYARSFVLLALLGCTGTGPGSPSETGHTGETGLPGGTLAPPSTAGDCAVDTTAAVPLAGAREVLAEPYGYATGLPDGLSAQVLSDEAAYEAFLASAGLTAPAVDFVTELAVVVAYGVNATCGLTVEGWDAWDVGGTPHVELRVVDASFACETVCDMAADLVAVVAVPRAATATVCAKVGGGCGAAP